MTYRAELSKAMEHLAKHPKTLFVGQSVEYGGQAMWPTFENVPAERRIEMPVAEDMQMGVCTGLALAGFIPVCVYTRWDFLLLAANQLVNLLDKIPLMSPWQPKVIIRVAVGPRAPLNAGPQHTQDHTQAFRCMLKTIPVFDLNDAGMIEGVYENALEAAGSVLIVEHMALYSSAGKVRVAA
jgi:pyruvate/2-oxoglutarate/acetoin dehydrogenase E1 component